MNYKFLICNAKFCKEILFLAVYWCDGIKLKPMQYIFKSEDTRIGGTLEVKSWKLN